ncbi:C-type lectin domain family 17, member A-like isoform X1 [Cyprinus carpio]|uniref:C-type lectin domain family 17, member A-like isoform X1 n=2 Tax=Cyprinus carpio TaxID=7962 RepID=A0A9Q9WGD0_CYPCA|nr:C-type lectin domain family 17, member A-like isoform X1 [Cyprinus carpio]
MRTDILLLLSSALMNMTFSLRHEFVYVPSSVNWTTAQKYCKQHYSDLATVDDQADHNELLKTAGMGNVWIGLYRTTGDGAFVWSDQSSSSFKAWESGQPNNQLCVNIYGGKWYDRDCVGPVPFACSIDRKRQIMRVEVKSSQNLKDPAVMNGILGKMEQIMKEKGLAQYAKLSWITQSNGNVFQKNYKRDAPKQTCDSKLRK